MIYPTKLTVLLAAAAAPIALAVALAAPGAWAVGLLLIGLLVVLAAVDALAGQRPGAIQMACEGPQIVNVGETFRVDVRARGNAVPRRAEVALEVTEPLALDRPRARLRPAPGLPAAGITMELRADRRGTGAVRNVWLRMPGLLGLVWKQRRFPIDRDILVTPDIRLTRDQGILLSSRELIGQMSQREMGEGAEFDSLADYRPGMDRRSIDWKQSARHTKLIAKEYRIERNNNIIVAIDCGRTMSEPTGTSPRTDEDGGVTVDPGVPRMDSSVAAALLTAFVALKQGDRVGLFAFDSKPRASSKVVSGPAAFTTLQRVAAGIDYSDKETNYTLGLATLASGLKRRSLIILFTEFTDTVSAELMFGALAPLLNRHLLLFVVLRDSELEAFAAAEPVASEDVSRAVAAAGLLRERRLVLTRLRHLGVEVVEADAAEAGPALVNAYLDLKRRGRL